MAADPFEQHPDQYDAWYDRHPAAYRSELDAVRSVLGPPGRALEVGVGTGRFAAPLGIRVGIDPAEAMARRARDRGIRVARAVGERLPFPDRCFDAVLIALTLCFFESPGEALTETARVLRPDGRLVLGYLDPTTPSGRAYLGKRGGLFYQNAEFHSPARVEDLLGSTGFRLGRVVRTLSRRPEAMEEIERPSAGADQGMFAALEAVKR